jgi:hypothetical protein
VWRQHSVWLSVWENGSVLPAVYWKHRGSPNTIWFDGIGAAKGKEETGAWSWYNFIVNVWQQEPFVLFHLVEIMLINAARVIALNYVDQELQAFILQ